jgi:hypothetical protein
MTSLPLLAMPINVSVPSMLPTQTPVTPSEDGEAPHALSTMLEITKNRNSHLCNLAELNTFVLRMKLSPYVKLLSLWNY